MAPVAGSPPAIRVDPDDEYVDGTAPGRSYAHVDTVQDQPEGNPVSAKVRLGPAAGARSGVGAGGWAAWAAPAGSRSPTSDISTRNVIVSSTPARAGGDGPYAAPSPSLPRAPAGGPLADRRRPQTNAATMPARTPTAAP